MVIIRKTLTDYCRKHIICLQLRQQLSLNLQHCLGIAVSLLQSLESCAIGSISMVVNRIHLHLALVVLKDAILLQTAKCTTSSILCFSTMCLCKFVCIVEQNVQGLGILLFFFINLPVPGQLFAPSVAPHLEYVLVLR